MKRDLLLVLSLALFVQKGLGQSKIKRIDGNAISTVEIDKTIKRLMDTAEVMGLSLAVINDNRVVYLKTYGFKNKAKNEWIDTATVFYGASFSKAVFAYLVMQLVQEGKLELDKPLYLYLNKPIPEYDDFKDLAGDERWKLVTARHCLSHTTGLPNWRQLNPKRNNKLEFFFDPGARYAYSGEGLVLLQLVIEAIAGDKLENMARQRVFQPLGMHRTSYIWQPSFETDYAIGYTVDGDPLDKRKRTTANAAGSMETTIADYARFITSVMQGKGLTAKAKSEMLSPQISIHTKGQFPSLRNDTSSENEKIKLSYGLGWGLLTSPYGKAFFKEGHDDGWVHYNINFMDKKTSIIIMSNSSNGESIFKEVLEKIIGDVYTPWKWENYIPYRAAVKLPEAALQQYAGVYEMGEVQALVTIEGGKLRVVAEKGGLPKRNLYAQTSGRFYIKDIPMEMEFVKGADGKVEKMIAWEGDERNELKKIK
jgi:CubicO group peptidase (beta-lactamase class C family)